LAASQNGHLSIVYTFTHDMRQNSLIFLEAKLVAAQAT
jgi:hypothetical protein